MISTPMTVALPAVALPAVALPAVALPTTALLIRLTSYL